MLLTGIYALHDVQDVEALCTQRARRWCKTTGIHLTAAESEDLIGFLIISVWRMSRTYDPAKSSSFQAIVIGRLGNRCVDWLRAYKGRTRWQFGDHTYERKIEQPICLDADRGEDQLGDTDATGGVDALDDRLSTLARVHGVGSVELAWHKANVRAAAARRAQARADAARERSSVAKRAAVF